MQAPYFLTRQKLSAEILIHDERPYQRMTYSARKVFRSFWFTVSTPQFVDVDANLARHLESALQMMTNYAAQNTGNQRGVKGGVKVDPEWIGTDGSHCTLQVYPRSNKYLIDILKDELGNVLIDIPAMKFTNDIPGMNQARRVLGQVVEIARSMRGY